MYIIHNHLFMYKHFLYQVNMIITVFFSDSYIVLYFPSNLLVTRMTITYKYTLWL